MDILELLENLTVEPHQQAIIDAAVDEIERLRGEVEHLHKMTVKWSVLQVEGSQENQRLREALEIAADGFMNCGAEDLEDMCRAVIAKATGGE
jgi:hypothetical protein